jgi:uncharacterized protein YbjT (DUF2867 family)
VSAKRIIAVVGATGAQGGGLARAILNDPSSAYTVRALVRDPASDKARALAAAGADVVQADIDDPLSLTRALDGAYGAFFVTFYWAHFSPEREQAEAAAMARAARTAGLKHVIWSTLEDTREFMALDDPRMPVLMQRYKVPHFDAKGESNRVFAEQGVPTTYLLTSAYWENLIHFGWGPKRGADGRLAVAFPTGDKKVPWIGAEDIGRCAYGIFKACSAMIGRTVGVSGEHLSGGEIAAGLSRALGEPIDYLAITPEQYRALDFPGADDLGNMWQFKRDFNDRYRAARDVNAARELNPALQRFEDWLRDNAARIPVSRMESEHA